MPNTTPPAELLSAIGSEPKDFIVSSKRRYPLRKSIPSLIFGFIWLSFTSSISAVFMLPVLLGSEVHFTVNNTPTVAGPGNLAPLLFPAIILSVFLIVGLVIVISGIVMLFAKGSWFAGLPKGLMTYRKGISRFIDWEQFSGDIEVRGDEQRGSIALQLRTGTFVSRKNGPPRYVPEVIFISGIPHARTIEQQCRRRIQENDPTPSQGIGLAPK